MATKWLKRVDQDSISSLKWSGFCIDGAGRHLRRVYMYRASRNIWYMTRSKCISPLVGPSKAGHYCFAKCVLTLGCGLVLRLNKIGVTGA